MKKGLHVAYVFIVSICLSAMVKGQSTKQLAYVVTDSVHNGAKWNYLRKVDLRTGNFSNILLRLLNRNDTVANATLFNGVAAIALDDKSKRLYYTPMFADRLSYVDLKTLRTYVVTNSFTGLFPKAADQSNIFTRMVIGDDDNGYALTNDSKHLVKFNTRNNRITDLGSLINAPQNVVSVHEICSSYGGDIIAAADDLLYLITSRNHVFKIRIETRVAKYMGTITGLPQTFTTSSAAVDYRNNRVVIASSTDVSDIYSVDFKTLVAVGLHSANPWLSSDLANSNILKLKKDDEDDDRSMLVNTDLSNEEQIQVFPNPVTSREFKIQFANTASGAYTISVINITGQTVTTQTENLAGKNNIVAVKLPGLAGKGIYIVKITDKYNKTVFSEKIVLL
jgi:Secretion system C-terminal sorting domain